MQKGVVRKRPPSQLSEYGKQLHEKQELKSQYGLGEKQFRKYVIQALSKGTRGSESPETFVRLLEKRLDSFVFRMGLAETRKQARQLVSHGHFTVNGKSCDVPSYQLRADDKVAVRLQSLQSKYFQERKLGLKKYDAPSWVRLDKEKVEAVFSQEPTFQEVATTVEIPLIFEFYSR